jgi:hypothetical protein
MLAAEVTFLITKEFNRGKPSLQFFQAAVIVWFFPYDENSRFSLSVFSRLQVY